MGDENLILPPRYSKPQRIGHGGMGDIYLARDSLLDREVAIKVLAERYAGDESTRERFTREALAAARLSSEPGTVTIFDVGEWEGRPFIVMEHLGGGSLEHQVRGGRPPTAQALTWLEQAARALDAAHAQGVVHRDVKPGNLLLDEAGEVHVADFGIASATGMDSLTIAGTILGTAGYLSPEQATGERATAASDRYALAIVAFELLTGRRPYERESPTAEAAAHASAPVPSVREYAPDLPWADLDAVFRRALAKEPAARYGSCLELIHDLRAALTEGETRTQVLAAAPVTEPTARMPTPPPPPTRRPPPARRGRGPSARVLALVGLLIAALAAGAALAAALADGDGEESGSRVSVRTITQEGRTVRQSVTVTTTTEPTTTAPTTSAQTATTTAPTTTTTTPTTETVALDEARRLNDQAFGLMNEGRYEEALPIAQRALASLEGSGDQYEAFANYNVGRSLIELGRCEEGLPYIDRSQELQGPRSEFGEARAKCR
jgi:eukaryotic-like serine/threonine-protein kinase